MRRAGLQRCYLEKVSMRTPAFVVVLIWASIAAGQSPSKTGRGNYLVFPVRTELQRLVLFDKHTKYYVLVNGSAAIAVDQAIDPKAIDFSRLEKDLMREPFLKDDTSVRISVAYDRSPPEEGRKLLYYALTGVGHHLFKEIKVVSDIGGDRWKTALAIVKESGMPMQDTGEEFAIADGLPMVYPVRTLLSRFILTNADCVVVIGEPRGRAPEPKVIAKQEKRIAEAVGKLKLNNKDRLVWYFGESPREPEEAKEFFAITSELTKKLGFKSRSVISR